MLSFLAARAIAGMEVVEGDAYGRVIDLDGVQGSVWVHPAPRDDVLVANVRFARLSALPTIIARLRRMFDLAADPEAINGHLSQDPALAPLVATRPGLRAPGGWDGFELALRAFLASKSLSAAIALAGRLVAAYGDMFRPRQQRRASNLAFLGRSSWPERA